MLNRAVRLVVTKRSRIDLPQTLYGRGFVFQEGGKNYEGEVMIEFTVMNIKELPQ